MVMLLLPRKTIQPSFSSSTVKFIEYEYRKNGIDVKIFHLNVKNNIRDGQKSPSLLVFSESL